MHVLAFRKCRKFFFKHIFQKNYRKSIVKLCTKSQARCQLYYTDVSLVHFPFLVKVENGCSGIIFKFSILSENQK